LDLNNFKESQKHKLAALESPKRETPREGRNQAQTPKERGRKEISAQRAQP